MTTKKKAAHSTPQAAQSNLKTLQRDAKALVTTVRKEAVRFSHEQKRALDRIATEAGRLRSDFERLVKRTSRDLESRSKRLLSTLEKEAGRALSRFME